MKHSNKNARADRWGTYLSHVVRREFELDRFVLAKRHGLTRFRSIAQWHSSCLPMNAHDGDLEIATCAFLLIRTGSHKDSVACLCTANHSRCNVRETSFVLPFFSGIGEGNSSISVFSSMIRSALNLKCSQLPAIGETNRTYVVVLLPCLITTLSTCQINSCLDSFCPRTIFSIYATTQ